MTQLAPVADQQRIQSLDVLRGFAVLGILLMNIQHFSMLEPAYINPTAYGDLTGLNKLVWVLSHLLADSKFMSMFSILFGASALLVITKAEAAGRKPAGLHYRRNLWLLLIGHLHAYLFWSGDILVTYATCAFWVYFFRKRSVRALLIIGLLLVLVPVGLWLFFGLSMEYWPPESVAETMKSWQPSAEVVAHENQVYRDGLGAQLADRATKSFGHQTFLFLIHTLWRAGGLMLVGMALLKSGVLGGLRSRVFYLRGAIIGAAIGFPLVGYGIFINFQKGWTLEFSMFLGSQINEVGSLFVCWCYICLLVLAVKSSVLRAALARLAMVGRMALSNYLGQTLVCTTLFYGHGLGLFGSVERTGQLLIVLGVWALQLLVSPLWMKRFRFGPMEWLWRSLTYGRRQPMLRRTP
jgi:uncharacterized protein